MTPEAQPVSRAETNRLVVEALYDAITRGDVSAAESCLATDVVVHIGGTSRLAGNHEGRTAVLELGLLVLADTGGSHQTTVLDMWANDSYVVVHQRWTATRNSRSVDMPNFIVYRCHDGLIAERWEYLNDLTLHDEFWS